MKHCTLTNEVLCGGGSWIYLQVLFESLFYLTELLNMAVLRNSEIYVGPNT
jgi:hypothetical protein